MSKTLDLLASACLIMGCAMLAKSLCEMSDEEKETVQTLIDNGEQDKLKAIEAKWREPDEFKLFKGVE